MAEQFSIPTIGDVIAGKYRVEGELGRGAYGVVFRAEQEELGRHVAVKTLLPQAFLQKDIVQRFHREAQLISRLDHPNIIRLYDYGMDEGLLYMAVEYVEGRTLMDVIERDAPVEPVRARALALQILDALVHAHAQGIVHRDLKPDNIVLLRTRTTDEREFEVVKILDFGISKLLRGDEESNGPKGRGHNQKALKSLTQDGTVLGTPHYMSPENIVGDPIDHRADLYAFGVILYELLIGKHPFDAPSPSAVMVRHLRDDPPDLPDHLRETVFNVAIHRCLEKQPWDRIGSASELIAVLETTDASSLPPLKKRPSQELRSGELGPDEETIVRPSSATQEAAEPRSRSLPWVLVGVLAVALLTVIVVWTMTGGDGVAAETTQTALVEPTPVVEEVATPADAPEPMVFAPEPAELHPTDELPPDEPADPTDDAPEVEVATATTTPQPKRAPRPQPTPAAPTEVELEVTSIPASANVVIDGVPVGETPLQRVFALNEPVEVRFSHIGYKDMTVRVTPSSNSGPIRAHMEKVQLRLVE